MLSLGGCASPEAEPPAPWTVPIPNQNEKGEMSELRALSAASKSAPLQLKSITPSNILNPEGQSVVDVAAAGALGPFLTLTRAGQAALWSGEGDQLLTLPQADAAPLSAIALHPETGALALGDSEGQIQILSPEGQVLQSHSLGGGGVHHLAFSLDGTRLVGASHRRMAYVMDGAGERIEQRFGPFPSPILSLTASPKGEFLALGLRDRSIVVLSADSPTPILRLRIPKGQPLDLRFLPDGRGLLASAGEGGAYLFGPKGSKPLALVSRGVVNAAEVSADGSIFYLGRRDGKVSVWDGVALSEVGMMGSHSRAVSALAALGGGGVVSGSQDGSVILWRGLD